MPTQAGRSSTDQCQDEDEDHDDDDDGNGDDGDKDEDEDENVAHSPWCLLCLAAIFLALPAKA